MPAFLFMVQILQLRYGNGRYAMTVFLPYAGYTTAHVMEHLTAAAWADLQHRFSTQLVDVGLPRFEQENNVDLCELMKSLGMPKAFDPDDAEFPNVCNSPVYIGKMNQVTRIKLSEEGTEAAAVTVVGFVTSSASAPTSTPFYANRPFVYVISELSSGTIFFVGQYAS